MRSALRVRLATTILFLSLLPVAIYFMICSVIADAVTRPLRKEIEQTPLQSGLAHVEAVSFGTDDRITLQGYFLPSSGDRAIVLVHGVHSHCWDGQSPDLSRALVETGFSVLVFDRRAHGRSGGERVGLGWRERQDVSAAVKFLRSRGFNSGKIGIHGTSYGAATALLAAVTVPEIGAVVADSAFADIRELIGAEIQRRMGLAEWAANALMPGTALVALGLYSLDLNDVSPERAVAEISPRPILLIHGEDDPITPVEHAKRLAAAAPAAELWILPGLGHTEGVRLAPDFRQASPLREAYLRRVPTSFNRPYGSCYFVRGYFPGRTPSAGAPCASLVALPPLSDAAPHTAWIECTWTKKHVGLATVARRHDRIYSWLLSSCHADTPGSRA